MLPLADFPGGTRWRCERSLPFCEDRSFTLLVPLRDFAAATSGSTDVSVERPPLGTDPLLVKAGGPATATAEAADTFAGEVVAGLDAEIERRRAAFGLL